MLSGSCLALGVAVGACAGSSGPDVSAETSGVQMRDSAGVEIVEIPPSLLGDLPIWGLSAEPTLSIGVADGEAPYLLSRVTTASRLASGEILVVDGQSRELRVFDSTGVHLRSYGRRGEGPGEFVALDNASAVDGIRISAFDYPAGRITTVDLTDGSFESRPQPPSCGRSESVADVRCEIVGVLADGTPLAYLIRSSATALNRDGGLSVTQGPRIRLGPVVEDAVVAVDSIQPRGVVQHGYGTDDFFGGTALFAPGGQVALGASTFVVGDPMSWQVQVRDATGALERVIRVLAAPIPVTAELLAEYRAWADTAERAREVSRVYLASLQPGGTVPFFGELRQDRLGRIWASDYQPFWAFGPQSEGGWTIFTHEGIPAARLVGDLPGTVHEIGVDYILVTEVDDLGVESVRSYRLEEAESG